MTILTLIYSCFTTFPFDEMAADITFIIATLLWLLERKKHLYMYILIGIVYLLYVPYANEHTRVISTNIDYFLTYRNGPLPMGLLIDNKIQ